MKPDGGPAFPTEFGRDTDPTFGMTIYEKRCPGMSMRDWFAGQAEASGQCPFNQHQHHECVQWSYARADAMLKEREK